MGVTRLFGAVAALAVAGSTVIATSTIAPQPAAAASGAYTAFSAEAYGSFVSAIGGMAKSGPTALSVLGCTSQVGLSGGKSTAAIHVPLVGSVGAVNTSTRTAAITGGVSDSANSSVASVDLLGGLISADAITTTATAKKVGNTRTAIAKSSLASLQVAGVPIDVAGKPNLTLDLKLPGTNTAFAKLTLNQQVITKGTNRITMTARAIDIVVTDNNPLGLPIKTRIVVGLARATIAPSIQGRLNGVASGTRVAMGKTVLSSPTAYLPMNCMGSKGTNRVASVNTDLVDTGVVTSRVAGTTDATAADSRTSNTIAGVSLLGGVLSADAIVASAHARYQSGRFTIDANGTEFTKLQLLGKNISLGGIKQNTALNIPGIGAATLKKVEKINGKQIKVTMIELAITIGPDAGTTIAIGRATAGINR